MFFLGPKPGKIKFLQILGALFEKQSVSWSKTLCSVLFSEIWSVVVVCSYTQTRSAGAGRRRQGLKTSTCVPTCVPSCPGHVYVCTGTQLTTTHTHVSAVLLPEYLFYKHKLTHTYITTPVVLLQTTHVVMYVCVSLCL